MEYNPIFFFKIWPTMAPSIFKNSQNSPPKLKCRYGRLPFAQDEPFCTTSPLNTRETWCHWMILWKTNPKDQAQAVNCDKVSGRHAGTPERLSCSTWVHHFAPSLAGLQMVPRKKVFIDIFLYPWDKKATSHKNEGHSWITGTGTNHQSVPRPFLYRIIQGRAICIPRTPIPTHCMRQACLLVQPFLEHGAIEVR